MLLVLLFFLIAALTLTMTVFFTAEGRVLSEYRGEPLVHLSTYPGLEDALTHVLKASGQRARPRIFATPDVEVRARVVRRPGSPGAILVSRGLMESLGDDELISVVEEAVRILRSSGIFYRSGFSALWTRVSKVYRTPLTPLRALISCLVFPLEEIFRAAHGRLDVLAKSGSSVR